MKLFIYIGRNDDNVSGVSWKYWCIPLRGAGASGCVGEQQGEMSISGNFSQTT